MKIVIYSTNGSAREFHNIVGFLHMEHGLIQFTHHNVEGTQESIRTSLPFAIVAESNAEIAECDRSYGSEKGD